MSNHTNQPVILVIDDDPSTQRVLRTVLSASGYEAHIAPNGTEGLALARQHTPDLLILDILMPDMDGITVCRELRTWYAGPILVLSVESDEASRISMLDQGADDFVSKPFSHAELLARVRALLRRSSRNGTPQTIVSVGDLVINLALRQVTLAGQDVKLTPLEYGILAMLARNAGCVVSQRTLLEQVWGPESIEDMTVLRVHVSRLRRKIEPSPEQPQYLLTEPCVGFRLKCD